MNKCERLSFAHYGFVGVHCDPFHFVLKGARSASLLPHLDVVVAMKKYL